MRRLFVSGLMLLGPSFLSPKPALADCGQCESRIDALWPLNGYTCVPVVGCIIPPVGPPAVPSIPSPGEIVDNFRKEIENAGVSASPVVQQALAQGGTVLEQVGAATQQVIIETLQAHDQAVSEATKTIVSAAAEIVDAGNATANFARAQIAGMGAVISDAQRRLAEGKVVDALWHISADMIGNTVENGLTATEESALLGAAASTAAGAYGGPAGAAMLAAARAYRATNGNLQAAMMAGVHAYAVGSGYANVGAMPTGTAGEVLRKAAATGAMTGVIVGASGGSPEDMSRAFVNAGSGVLVQASQSYLSRTYVQPAIERADRMCMSASDGACQRTRQWVETRRQQALEAQRRFEDARKRLQDLQQYTDTQRRRLEAERDEALGITAAASPSNRVLVTRDRQWAISWNADRVRSLAAGEPVGVLTYVGTGSPLARTAEELRQVTAKPVSANPQGITPQTTTSGRQLWVAFSDVGASFSFFRRVGSSADPGKPRVGDTLRAVRDVNIRPGPARWVQAGTLSNGTVVVVQEVRRLPAGSRTQTWMRIEQRE